MASSPSWTLFRRESRSQPRRRSGDASEQRKPMTLTGRVQGIRSVCATLGHHLKHHFGVGIVCAVAYFDPGNWSTDLLAGSQFGYKLLFIVLLAGLGAVVLQVLSAKLGCVTGLDLAAHCRLLLHDHPRFPRFVRYVFLYPLYVLSELAIVSTDIAELLGSAIGLVLLIPELPLPVAVLLTASDVIFILAVGDPTKGHGKPVRVFEMVIITLVLVVFSCFIVLLVRVSPDWPDVFDGYLPSKALVEPSALYAAVGIVGATVMPHGLYLGSHLATHDRVSSPAAAISALPTPSSAQVPSSRLASIKKTVKTLFSARRVRRRGEEDQPDTWTPYGERKNNTLSFVKAHYKHGLWDLVLSLLGFAVVINSAILILAGAVFFFGPGKTANGMPAGLFDAFDLIRDLVGKPAAIVFAIALICSGQSASITATLAGQIVSEGFIQWSISPFLRRLVTRFLGLIPSMLVAIIVGRAGIDTLLVISQVVLSIVLPFVMFPLIWLTSSSVVMRVQKPRELVQDVSPSPDTESRESEEGEKDKSSFKMETADEGPSNFSIAETGDEMLDPIEFLEPEFLESEKQTTRKEGKGKGRAIEIEYVENAATPLSVGDTDSEFIDYSNGWALTTLSYAIWLVILVANGYLIVTLAIG